MHYGPGHVRLAAAAAFALVAMPGSARTLADTAMPVAGQLSVFAGEESPGNVTLAIDGEIVAVEPDGSFSHAVEPRPLYQLTASGEGFHTSVQTFAHAELYDDACTCLQVPQIELVARRPGRVELLFAGDAMAGRRYSQPVWGERQLVDPAEPYPDLMQLLGPIRPYVESADIASVNLETVLADSDPGDSPPKSVVFYAPTALAQALADSGFDYVSLGNNHSYDYLDAGLRTTIAAIERAGLAWSGAGFDARQSLQPAQVASDGSSFAMLGYVGWQGNVEPNQVAEPGKGGAAYGTEANIRTSVAEAREAGMLPVVQLHGSREYSERPTEISTARTRAAVEEGAIIVASHHPHVTQGIELRDGAVIAYSLGNFLFDQYFMLTHASYALKVWIEDGAPIRAEVIPLRILDYRPVPAVGSSRQFVIDRVERLSGELGTHFTRNGGHLAVDLAARPDGESMAAEDPARRTLVYWGDFENSRSGDAVDRTLSLVGGTLDYRFTPAGGTVLALRPDAEATSLVLRPTTFFRSITRERAEFSGRIRARQPLQAEILVQYRPRGTGRFEALETQPFVPVGELDFTGSDEWQDFAGTFAVPLRDDGAPAPFRLALRFHAGQPLGGIEIDDLEVATIGDQAGG